MLCLSRPRKKAVDDTCCHGERCLHERGFVGNSECGNSDGSDEERKLRLCVYKDK